MQFSISFSIRSSITWRNIRQYIPTYIFSCRQFGYLNKLCLIAFGQIGNFDFPFLCLIDIVVVSLLRCFMNRIICLLSMLRTPYRPSSNYSIGNFQIWFSKCKNAIFVCGWAHVTHNSERHMLMVHGDILKECLRKRTQSQLRLYVEQYIACHLMWIHSHLISILKCIQCSSAHTEYT